MALVAQFPGHSKQRLSREEQLSFNEKYLALPPVLQQYSKLQFTSLPEDRQEHAYRMFLVLDIETLEEVIARELDRQNEVETIFNDERTLTCLRLLVQKMSYWHFFL